MLSEDDREVDVESDDGEDSDNRPSISRPSSGNQFYSQQPLYTFQAEKRAHHNALERKRRDHIKDSFSSLRDSVPALNGEKASRAQILKKAAEYIMFMKKKNNSHQQDIEDLKRQNSLLEAQIRTLEKSKQTGVFDSELTRDGFFNDSPSDGSDVESSVQQRPPKKLRGFH
ncbi:protein max-like isoform X1 [Euwallacea fornicatus]|uniref:protein max-like isoform X1 n=1 Tax=Euwallacea fornicatus TaxID=995702 RepID=UPI00338FB014